MKLVLVLLAAIMFFLHLWFVWIPVWLYTSIRYGSGWFIPVAFLLDGYYGSFYTFPLLTLVATVWYVVIAVARSRFMVS